MQLAGAHELLNQRTEERKTEKPNRTQRELRRPDRKRLIGI